MSTNGDIYTDANGQVHGPLGIITSPTEPQTPDSSAINGDPLKRGAMPQPPEDAIATAQANIHSVFGGTGK